MNVLYLLLLSIIVLYLASRLYGRLVSRWLGLDPNRPTPAVDINDSRDYAPANPNVLFGHHFATIAGAGPIVGPTLAVLYGYLPVWLWIIIGGVLFGAVHDFSTLFVSLRERGRSIAEIARATLGDRGFALFIGFASVMIILVTSAFLAMTAMSLTSMETLKTLGLEPGQHLLREVSVTNPETGQTVVKGVIGGIASTSVIVITALAPLLGWLLYRRRIHALLGYALAILICLGGVVLGFRFPVTLSPQVWMIVISIYVIFAAGVPVWLILQPRDFVNVQILYAGIAAMLVGLFIGGFQGMTLQMPSLAIGEGAAKMGLLWPMLFITVACGAISGFHSLVATGTTSKQLAREGHARAIGFNGMLLESLMAVCAMLVVAAMLSQGKYMDIIYPTAVGAKGNQILAFALSVGLLLYKTLGLSVAYGTVFGILLLEGFVVTTLDSAVRLNRYLFEELWPLLFKDHTPAFLRWPWFNSALSAALMLLLAWKSAFNYLWPLFATGNQMLAALALIAVSAWLLSRRRQAWFTLLPAGFMVVTTLASLILMFVKFWSNIFNPNLLLPLAKQQEIRTGALILLPVDILMFVLSLGVVALSIRAISRFKTQLPAAREAVGV